MARDVWVVAETTADGRLAKLTTEVAAAGAEIAAATGGTLTGIVVAADPAPAAAELAGHVSRILTVADEGVASEPAPNVVADHVAAIAARDEPAYILTGASPDGRDIAGILSALLGWGVLGNVTGLERFESTPVVKIAVFGGSAVTTSVFNGSQGIFTIRPNVFAASATGQEATIEAVEGAAERRVPTVKLVERITEAGAAAPIEEASIVVVGGRGVAGADGVKLVEELAEALGGAVGATRAAVDSGWIPYSQQIGQTGKSVKPKLYFALGVSGAIQHRVGMQTAETIIAVNRDPEAPIAEFADLYVVGDLFELAPAIVAELRSRTS